MYREGYNPPFGGVATSIDLGLYLIKLFLGSNEVEKIKQQMDYPYSNTNIVVVEEKI